MLRFGIVGIALHVYFYISWSSVYESYIYFNTLTLPLPLHSLSLSLFAQNSNR